MYHIIKKLSKKYFSIAVLCLASSTVIFFSKTLQATPPLTYQELRTPHGIKVLFHHDPNAVSVSLAIGFKDPQTHTYIDSHMRSLFFMRLTKFLLDTYWHQFKLTQPSSYDTEKQRFNVAIDHPKHHTQLVWKIFLNSTPAQLEAALAQTFSLLQQAEKSSPVQLQSALDYLKFPLTEPLSLRSTHYIWRYLLITGVVQQDTNLITETLFKNITSEDLKHYTRRLFTQDQLFIGASGNIEPEKLLQLIDHYFGKLPHHPAKPNTRYTASHPKSLFRQKTFQLIKDTSGHLTYLSQYWHPKTASDATQLANLPLILLHLIGDNLDQALQEQGLSLLKNQADIRLSFNELPYTIFRLVVSSSKQATADIVTNVIAVLRQIKQQGVSLAQLQMAKEFYLNSPRSNHFKWQVDTVTLDSLTELEASYLLDEQLSTPRIIPYALKQLEKLIDDPQALKAFNKALQTYLDPDQFIIFKIGPKRIKD
jgi:Peptidase M16 inactive domain